MLDIGWSEMAVIALVALVIIGPKDLPRVMRTMGQWMRKARAVSRDFQSSIDEMVREADLEDARKAIQSTKSFNIEKALDETVDPSGDMKKTVRDVEQAARDDGGTTGDGAGTKATEAIEAPKAASTDQSGGAGERLSPSKVNYHPPPPHSIVPPKEDEPPKAPAAAAAEPAPAEAPAKPTASQKSA